MPYTVELDLTPACAGAITRFDLPDAPAASEPHWLLRTWYGRDLLKAALAKFHPELPAPAMYRHAPEVDDHLEMVIDELKLRDWREPKTALDRARYVFAVAKMYPAISRGERSVRHLIG
jgi:hypothetical protein